MKRIIYAFCIAIFVSVFVLSCSGDEFYDGNPKDALELEGSDHPVASLNIPDQFKIIGEKHNEGLDAAFTAIRSHYEQVKTRSGDTFPRMSKDECLLIAEQGLQKFCAENVENYSDEFNEQVRGRMISKTRAQEETVNPKVYAFVEKMKKLLIDEPDSPAQLVRGLNDINKEATAELSEIEAIAVYAGTSTCYNSYMYWKENRMKWFIMLNNPDLVNEFNDDELNRFAFKKGKLVAPAQTRGWWDDAWNSVGETWDSTKDYVSDWWSNGGGKEVVGTDAGEAVKGAMEGALLGAYVEGWGAIPGAVVGGVGLGASGSISSAIQYWISN